MTEPNTPEAFAEAAASLRVTPAVLAVPGVTGLSPGLRDLVATAAARVMRREGGEPPSVDVRATREGMYVRVDAHLDASRSVSGIVVDLFEVIARGLQGAAIDPVGDIDIDVRRQSCGSLARPARCVRTNSHHRMVSVSKPMPRMRVKY